LCGKLGKMLDSGHSNLDAGCFAEVGGLGLIGFVFSSGEERDIVVSLCGEGDCVGFGVLGIGFVLRNKGAICRARSTLVEVDRGLRDGRWQGVWGEGRRRKTGDRKEKTDSRRAETRGRHFIVLYVYCTIL